MIRTRVRSFILYVQSDQRAIRTEVRRAGGRGYDVSRVRVRVRVIRTEARVPDCTVCACGG